MNWLKKWWNNRKEKQEQEIKKIICNEFKIVEKEGVLYLTHNGVAFQQIGKNTTAQTVASELNRTRAVAQLFRVI